MRILQSQMVRWLYGVSLLCGWGMCVLPGLAQEPVRFNFAPISDPLSETHLIEFKTLRSWAEANGQRKIDARLQSADDKEVLLLRADGESERWPLDRLSPANRNFVQHYLDIIAHEQVVAQSRFDFFAPGDERQEPVLDPPGENIPIPKAVATTKGFQLLPIHSAAPTWEVGPILPAPIIESREVVLPIRLIKPFFAQLSIMVAGEAPTIVVSGSESKISSPKSRGRFMVINAADETTSPIQWFAEPWQLIAISPSGDRCAAVRCDELGRGADLAIFNVTRDGVRPLFEFRPGTRRGDFNNVKWASFLPNNRLATLGEDNFITIWDLGHTNETGEPSPKVLFREITLTSAVAASPMGELLAINANGSSQIAMVRAADGRLLGTLPLNKIPQELAFSPDGKFLAVLFSRMVTIYRMTDGEEEKRFPISQIQLRFGAKFEWVGRHLMIGEDLYDLDLEFPIWTYQADALAQLIKPRALLGGMGFYVSAQKTHSTLVVAPIPHPEAIAAAAQLKPQDLTIHLQPGDGVRVSLAIDDAPYQLKREIELWVDDLLKEFNWVRADDAEAVMEIAVQKGELTEQFYYPKTGPIPEELDRVSFHPWRQQVVIKKGEHLLYHKEQEIAFPEQIELKRGESVQQAVTRLVQPDFAFYLNLHITPHLRQRKFRHPLGASMVTPVGFQQRSRSDAEIEFTW